MEGGGGGSGRSRRSGGSGRSSRGFDGNDGDSGRSQGTQGSGGGSFIGGMGGLLGGSIKGSFKGIGFNWRTPPPGMAGAARQELSRLDSGVAHGEEDEEGDAHELETVVRDPKHGE